MTRVGHSSKRTVIALGVLLGTLGCFYLGFLNGRTYLWEDLLYMIHPAFNYLTDSLAVGRFPLWLSGLRCGIPFFSEPWVYYPPIWGLSFWVHDGQLSALAIQWFFVGQLFLGGVFTYLFLRDCELSMEACTAGMVVSVFSAFLSLHIIHGGMGHAFLWLPFELFFVKRIVQRRDALRNALYLMLSIWMSFLAGFPQSVLYNAYFLTAYWLFLALQNERGRGTSWWWARVSLRECAKLAGVFIGVGLLGAVVILSTVQSWAQSQRQEFGFAQIADQSLPWYYLIHGLAPNFFGASLGDGSGIPFWGFNKDTLEYTTWHAGAWMYWEFGFYAGQLALIAIAVLAFNVRWLWKERREMVFFLAVLPIVLWLMLGRYGGLFNIFYHIAPGFSMFRTPARMSCLFDFSAAVLAAVFVDALWRGRPALKLKWPLTLLGAIYVVLFFAVLLYGGSMFKELNDPRLLQHSLTQIGVSAALFAGIAVLLVGIKRFAERDGKREQKPAKIAKKRGGASAVGGNNNSAFASIATFGSKSSCSGLQDEPDVSDAIPVRSWKAHVLVWVLLGVTFLDLYLAFHKFHQGRINPEDYYADRNGLIAQMAKLREQQGPFRFAQLRDGRISEEVVFPRNIGYLYPGYEALEGYVLFNLKDMGVFNSITNDRVRLDIENVGVIANIDSRTRQVGLVRHTNSLPRVKFYHEVRAYRDAGALCAELEAGRLDYYHAVGLLSEDCVKYNISTASPPAKAIAQVQFVSVNTDEYKISYTTSAPGIIFVSESYYPGWQADGGHYPMVRAFGAFKGIVISEAGSGSITVKFSPRIFWIGLSISAITLIILLSFLGVLICRGRKRTRV